MISNEKFRDLLGRMLQKSKRNEVLWQKDRDDRNNFLVDIDENTQFTVGGRFSNRTADLIQSRLVVKGQSVAWLAAEDGDEGDEYALLRQLFDDAQRCVFGWDVALEKLEAALSSDAPIGLPPKMPDDIPF